MHGGINNRCYVYLEKVSRVVLCKIKRCRCSFRACKGFFQSMRQSDEVVNVEERNAKRF